MDSGGSQLVTPKIKCSNDQWIGSHAVCHFSINFILFLFGWQSVAIQIKELGAIKSDSVSAVRCDCINILRELDICRENNVTAIARGRTCLAQLSQFRYDSGPF